MKIKLKTWTNNYQITKDDLKELGNDIIAVSKSGQGHIITYRHATLSERPRKGDLVEYYSRENWGRGRWKKGIVQGTEKTDKGVVLKDHLDIDNTIISISDVRKIIKRYAIPKKYLRYW